MKAGLQAILPTFPEAKMGALSKAVGSEVYMCQCMKQPLFRWQHADAGVHVVQAQAALQTIVGANPIQHNASIVALYKACLHMGLAILVGGFE
jgi:hypothetical protein